MRLESNDGSLELVTDVQLVGVKQENDQICHQQSRMRRISWTPEKRSENSFRKTTKKKKATESTEQGKAPLAQQPMATTRQQDPPHQ